MNDDGRSGTPASLGLVVQDAHSDAHSLLLGGDKVNTGKLAVQGRRRGPSGPTHTPPFNARNTIE